MNPSEINQRNEQNSARTKRVTEYYAILESLGYKVANYSVMDTMTNKIANGSNKPIEVLNSLSNLETELRENNLDEPIAVLRESFQGGLEKIEELLSKTPSNMEAIQKLLSKMKNNFLGLTSSERVQRTKASREKTQDEINAINEADALTASERKKLIALGDDASLTPHQKTVQKYAKLTREARWDAFKQLQYAKQGANLASIRTATSLDETVTAKLHSIRSINELEATLQEFQKLVLTVDFSREDSRNGIRESLLGYMRDLSEAISSYRTVLIAHDNAQKKYLATTEVLGLAPKAEFAKGKSQAKSSTVTPSAKTMNASEQVPSQAPKVSFDQFLKDKNKFTPESWSAFEQAYIEAMPIQGEEERIAAIVEAASLLVPINVENEMVAKPSLVETPHIVDKQPLEIAMLSVEQFIREKDKYTPESYAEFEDAYFIALAMPEATAEELIEKVTAIKNSATKLRPINMVFSVPGKRAANLTETAKMAIEQIVKNRNKYTPESYAAFEQAYIAGVSAATTEAEEVTAMRDASLLLNPIGIGLNPFGNHQSNLNNPFNAVPRSTNTLIATAMSSIAQVINDKTKFTSESYVTFEQAYNEALNMPEISEEDIFNKVTAIRNASALLRPININVAIDSSQRAANLTETAKLAVEQIIKDRNKYTPESYAAFEQAYINALIMPDELEEERITAIRNATMLLKPNNMAVNSPQLEPQIQVSNIKSTNSLVATAMASIDKVINEKNRFTPESYAAFVSAYNAALIMPEITDQDILDKVTAMRDASTLLRPSGINMSANTSQGASNLIETAKTAAEKFIKDRNKFTPESYAAFEQAYINALILPDEQLEEKLIAIRDASLLLKPTTIDFTQPSITSSTLVEKVKNQIDDYIKDKTNFTPESYAIFEQAYIAALAMPDDREKEKVAAIASTINLLKPNTKTKTEEKPNIDNQQAMDNARKTLRTAILIASQFTKEENKYTPESWRAFTKAYTEALTMPESTEQQILDKVAAVRNSGLLLKKLEQTKLDTRALDYTISLIEKIKETDYTPDSWQLFKSAYNNALAMPQETLIELNSKITAINNARKLLVISTLDFKALNEATKAAEDIKRSDFDAKQWFLFEQAYLNAKAMPQTTQREINDKVKAINEAIKYTKLDFTLLDKYINDANNLDQDIYTEESWESFLDLYTEATKNSPDSQSSIDLSVKKIEEAMSKLVKTPLKTDELDAIIEEIKMMPPEKKFTDASVTAFEIAYKAAQKMPQTTQQEIDDKIKAISAAKELLEELDFTLLEDANNAMNLIATVAFTPESLEKYNKAIKRIKFMPTKTQDEINAKATAIRDAIDLLVRVDLEELKNSKSAIDSLDTNEFTRKSWKKFQEELEAINKLPENNQKEIDLKAKKMQEAQVLLKKKRRLVRRFEKLIGLDTSDYKKI